MSTGETTDTSRQDGGLPGLLGGLIWGIVGLILTVISWVALGAYHATTGPENPERYADQELEAQVELFEAILSEAQFASEPIAEVLLGTFYAGHGIPTQIEGGGQTESFLLLDIWAALPQVDATTYLVVPAAVLGLCGFILARRAGSVGTVQGAIGGAFVVIGYGGLFCLGLAFATIETVDGAVQIGPETSEALLRGLGYPIVAGGIGGTLAGLSRS